jgi:acyl-coenzyme A synthetase/AMP-(fatty) acid ligase
MSFEYDRICSSWAPWSNIPDRFNLDVALTHEQVAAGPGDKPALLWEDRAGATRSLSYRQLDAASNRLATSLRPLGGDRDQQSRRGR